MTRSETGIRPERQAAPSEGRAVRISEEQAHEHVGDKAESSQGKAPEKAFEQAPAKTPGGDRHQNAHIAESLANPLKPKGAHRQEGRAGGRGEGERHGPEIPVEPKPGSSRPVPKKVRFTSGVKPEPEVKTDDEAPLAPQPRAPWYVQEGMLGEAEITDVPGWDHATAQAAARDAMAAFDTSGLSAALRTRIETHIAALLRTGSDHPDRPDDQDQGGDGHQGHRQDQGDRQDALLPQKPKDAEESASQWTTLLLRGSMFEADDRLVWVKPALDQPTYKPPSAIARAVRRYGVSFNSTAAEQVKEKSSGSALEGISYFAFNLASAAASTVVSGLPFLKADAAGTKRFGTRRNIINGRKLFVSDANEFTSGLRMRVFVDGRELRQRPGRQSPAKTRNPPADAAPADTQKTTRGNPPAQSLAGSVRQGPAIDRGIGVKFPADYSGADEPRPGPRQDGTDSTPSGPARQGPQKFRRGGEVLNAIDLTPAVADLVGQLRGQGLSASNARKIAEQAQTMLNEQTARNRSRWWLTSGDPGGKIRVGRGWNTFRGHPRIKVSIAGLQFLHVAKGGDGGGVKVREDLGGGLSTITGAGGDSSGSITGGFNVTGLVAPALEGHHHGPVEVKGIAPLAGGTFGLKRAWGANVTSQALGHVILNSTEEHARYRAVLRLDVNWNSRTHKGLTNQKLYVSADLGVPWQDGEGARDFERRVLGGVHTPYLQAGKQPQSSDETNEQGPSTRPAAEPGPMVWPTPVMAQPHVRALLHIAGLESDGTTVSEQPPDGIDQRPPGDPHPKESLALASRKGTGYAVAAALPGSELVEDQFRRRLTALSQRRTHGWGGFVDKITGRGPSKGLSSADRQLATHFGRPALEGDLSGLLSGYKEEVTFGGRRYELGVRGHLREHLDHRAYPMVVNIRAAVGETVATARDSRWSATFGLGAGFRVTIGKVLRLQIGGLRAQFSFGRGRGEGFGGTAKSYRRMENVNNVHEHVYNIAYELTLRPVGETRDDRIERRWVARPDELVAQVVIPEQHVPVEPVTAEQADSAGKVHAVKKPPQGRYMNFDTGASGLYPAFPAMPELAQQAARLYFRLNGLDETNAQHFAKLPKEIVNATRPEHLTAFFGQLTDKWGENVELPEIDGWKNTLTMKVAGFEPRQIRDADGDTEIEQYSQAVGKYTQDSSSNYGLQGQVVAGVTLRFGSDQSGTHDEPDSSGGGSGSSHPAGQQAGGTGHEGGHKTGHGASPGGRFLLTAHADYGHEWSTSKETATGAVEISRATHGGKPVRLGSDAVFSLTLTRQKGGVALQETVHLKADQALELLAPQRRVTDLMAPRPQPTETTSRTSNDRTAPQGARSTSRTGHDPHDAPGDALHAATVDASRPRPARTYCGDKVPLTAAYTERIESDKVLEQIEQRMRDRGVLRVRHDREGNVVDVPDRITRALRAVYRPEAMKTQTGALFDNGLWTWIPVRGFGGSTQYLYVNVTAERMSAPTSHRSRPDVDLTLRGETSEDTKVATKSTRVAGGGAIAGGRGGTHNAQTNAQFHLGGDIGSSYTDKVGRQAEKVVKRLGIYRATTKGSEEFEHDLTFRIEMGTVREMPEILKLVGLPGNGIYAGFGAVAGTFGRKEAMDQLWNANRPWIWRDDGTGSHPDGSSRDVGGSIRLIVPHFLTTTTPDQTAHAAGGTDRTDQKAQGGPEALYFTRNYGTNPRWQPRPPDRQHPATPELLENLHPWDLPASSAINRWVKFAAFRAVRQSDPAQGDEPWRIPGIDFTNPHGLAYTRRTSQALMRPNIKDLLQHNYRVDVGGRKVNVGIELSNGRVVTQDIRHKARRYRQEDAEVEVHTEHSRGWAAGAGIDGGGAEADQDAAYLGRLPYERLGSNTDKQVSALGQTDEHNEEGTRTFRYYDFDVTVVVNPDQTPGHQFRVDVPNGLTAMFPLTEDRTTLEGGLLTRHPELFAAVTSSGARAGLESGDSAITRLVAGVDAGAPLEEAARLGRVDRSSAEHRSPVFGADTGVSHTDPARAGGFTRSVTEGRDEHEAVVVAVNAHRDGVDKPAPALAASSVSCPGPYAPSWGSRAPGSADRQAASVPGRPQQQMEPVAERVEQPTREMQQLMGQPNLRRPLWCGHSDNGSCRSEGRCPGGT
ncbi:hypothetical protein OG568_60650 (plasmid) [Streptomyces sp. NBC_01450]|uniref:hypothetical protein n=1 Tax=Streptomyces sp. NBC_01450 TaxID=2903871 RepID=UPI002E3190AB|nr:hypothetical protein [Streptomyces sp. NBC_01450]